MSDAPRKGTIAHLPALDGLRALAVIGVLFFHDGRLKGGYLGVDLFFVLSGYLITSLIVAEHRATGRLDLPAFWVRRARRLFPALLLLMPFVALIAAFFVQKTEVQRVRWDGLATLAYVANWRAIGAGHGYWALFAAPSPLEHTWSLAIEEQFYVIFPLLSAFVLWRAKGSKRALFGVCVALAIASACVMVLRFSPEDTSRAYLGTDARGGSILMGAALACLVAERGLLSTDAKVRVLDGLGVVAIALLGVAWATLDGRDSRLYRGGFFAAEGLVAILIACAAHGERSFVARALSWKPLTWIGLVSYGLYLYHWPLYVVITKDRLGLPPLAISALRWGATFAVAYASYRLVEQPIRRRGLWFGRPIVIVPAAFAAAALSIVIGTRGALPPSEVAAREDEIPPDAVPPGFHRILVLGDSVAVSLGERMRAVSRPLKATVFVRATGDCNILHDQARVISLEKRAHQGGDCDASWIADARDVQPDATLVLLGGGFFAPVQVDGKWQRACEPGWRSLYVSELGRNLSALAPVGGRIYLALAPAPVGGWAEAAPKATIDCYNDALRDAARRAPGVLIFDLASELCPNGVCARKDRGEPIRPDGMHFGGPGAEEIARWTLGKIW